MRCNDDIDDGQLRKIAKKNESKTVCHEQGIKSDFLRKPADLVLGFYEIGS